MTTAEAMAEILRIFQSHKKFLVTSHAMPDGDAVGSVLALSGLLEAMGCESVMVLADPVPRVYRGLPGVDRIHIGASVGGESADVPCIVLECDGVLRTGLHGLGGRMLINIDHHATGGEFADVNWIDSESPAVGAMVYELVVASGVSMTSAMATCLYAAVQSDTGSFTYYGTTASTLTMAADLVRHGANPGQIAQEIYFSRSEGQVRLLGAALNKMVREGRLAWTWITEEEMAREGATAEDAEGIVNQVLAIEGIECAFFLRELSLKDSRAQGSRSFRLSLRSKGSVDVGVVAKSFGGGGHGNASGSTIDGPIAVAVELVRAQLRARL